MVYGGDTQEDTLIIIASGVHFLALSLIEPSVLFENIIVPLQVRKWKVGKCFE